MLSGLLDMAGKAQQLSNEGLQGQALQNTNEMHPFKVAEAQFDQDTRQQAFDTQQLYRKMMGVEPAVMGAQAAQLSPEATKLMLAEKFGLHNYNIDDAAMDLLRRRFAKESGIISKLK